MSNIDDHRKERIRVEENQYDTVELSLPVDLVERMEVYCIEHNTTLDAITEESLKLLLLASCPDCRGGGIVLNRYAVTEDSISAIRCTHPRLQGEK